MKILFLEQFSEMGGGQRNLADLLPAYVERGWKAVVAAPGDGPLFDVARAMGAETRKIEVGRYSNGQKTMADRARFLFDTARLRSWIVRQDCDAINVGGARLLPAAALAAGGRPVIFQALHYFKEPRAVRVSAWALRRAKATVMANSRHVARQFANHRDVHVIYQGVQEIPFKPRDFRGVWRIGLIGRIAPMKGQTDFLRAAASIDNAKFVVCGAPMFCPRSYANEVHRLAEGLPVEFLGWREDVAAVLGELDLLVVPSTAAEATTRVILEAFSAGVPVVAYSAGGIPEIVRDGENGFLVSECNPAALARKISALMRLDPRPIAEQARRDWEQYYTVARYRREMADAIGAIARSSGSPPKT
ncbi:MAG: glycosyltransferase family 4 protein [Bryobacteraceae bacterium]